MKYHEGFEYTTFTEFPSSDDSLENSLELLNMYGSGGWELVTTIRFEYHIRYILKRRVHILENGKKIHATLENELYTSKESEQNEQTNDTPTKKKSAPPTFKPKGPPKD